MHYRKLGPNYALYIPGTYRGSNRPRKHPAGSALRDLCNKKTFVPTPPEMQTDILNALANRKVVPGAALASSPKKAESPKSNTTKHATKGDGSWLFAIFGKSAIKPEPISTDTKDNSAKTWSATLFPQKQIQTRVSHKNNSDAKIASGVRPTTMRKT